MFHLLHFGMRLFQTQTERDSRKLKDLESQLRRESTSVQCLVDELAQLKVREGAITNCILHMSQLS